MNKKKEVAIIGIVGLPASYGGFETMVNYLTQYQGTEYNFTVYCQKTPKHDQLETYNNSRLVYLPFNANGSQSIIYDIYSILISWFKFDTLLILGTPGSIIIPLLKIFKKPNVIINFGGLEWKRDKWPRLAKEYLKLTEKIAMHSATTVVADNQHFCNYIKTEYKKDSVLIEYGSNHTKKIAPTTELISKYPFLVSEYDVSLSRAQADNNLHVVLEAYKNIPSRNIVLISNFNKFDYGKKIKERYRKYSNLILLDAIYNLTELDTIRSNAQVYIHSHSLCGTAPSLVEAMNLELPVIAYDTETNRFSTEEKALYFKNEKDLEEILRNLTLEKTHQTKTDMFLISNKRYKWEIISKKYASLF